MGGRLTFPGGGYYHASKHAVEALSDALRFEVQGFGVDVIVVEPGLVRTGFADAAVGTIADRSEIRKVPTTASTRPSPPQLRRLPERGRPHARQRSGGGRAHDRTAISARNPRTRYRVNGSARLFLTLRRLLPDRLWDAMMARTFPQPRP